MTGTFYGTLGVGPDADADEIRQAYRERVKECHPDVSSEPDARERFKRLTTAKETLTDERERGRYDRVGHASYVREHVESSVWSTTGASTGPLGRSGGPSGSERVTTRRSTGYRADSGAAGRRSAGRSETDGGGTHTDSGAETGARADRSPEDGSEKRSSGRSGGRRTARGNVRDGSSGTRSGARAPGRHSGSGSYARTSFWDAVDQELRGSHEGERYADPLRVRLLAGLRALGPWILVHAVFLSLAAGTSWFVYTRIVTDPASSLPLLFVLVGEVCLALVLSTLHVLSQLYR